VAAAPAGTIVLGRGGASTNVLVCDGAPGGRTDGRPDGEGGPPEGSPGAPDGKVGIPGIGPSTNASWIGWKFAQARRVLLAKWMTTERLPKKAPWPSIKET
jgi:hypothetical protein